MNQQRQDDQLDTYIQQLCADIGYSLEDLQRAMDDRDTCGEWVMEIGAGNATMMMMTCMYEVFRPAGRVLQRSFYTKKFDRDSCLMGDTVKK